MINIFMKKLKKGFTLIEVMVVISLSAVLGWMSYSGFSSLQNRFLDYQQKNIQFKTLQTLIKIMDLEMQKNHAKVYNHKIPSNSLTSQNNNNNNIGHNKNIQNFNISCDEEQTTCRFYIQKSIDDIQIIEYHVNNNNGFAESFTITIQQEKSQKIDLSMLKKPIQIKLKVVPWQQKQLFSIEIYQKNSVVPIERKWFF
jgi:prepilin-type N-terminal cleavage/methylation domain-containing protein